ncbi:nucleolus and neural progenitor protein isoform X2 [Cheilinus undulatus]|nr:nucleolus and neural progenitor protein isoform X2 [Cheilinus undulatus]
MAEIDKVLKLTGSEVLQTEVRVLYKLLYVLNNSFRGNKTFKGLQQVKQCVSRLEKMNLEVSLKELKELCPPRVQRQLGIKTGECEVPSQPMLEWLCLKVLGATQLMCCTLNRCSRAFILSKQQMKWEEFLILNIVISSMLSRLWVMFRGVLCCLSTLYQALLEILKDVAKAQPMPFLTNFSLPADVALFLDPSDALLLTKQSAHDPEVKQQRKKMPSVLVKNQRQTKKVKEDLGIAVDRGSVADTDMKPFLKIFNNFPKDKSLQLKRQKAERKQKFIKQLRKATTFTDMESCLTKMIQWCRSQRMKKERCLLTFLHLKCKRMKGLETAGYKIHKRFNNLRKEAYWAFSPQGSVPKSCRSSAAMLGNVRLRTPFHLLRGQMKSSAVRCGMKTKWMKKRRKRTEILESGLPGDNQRNRKTNEQTLHTKENDDIDDIFASFGL